MIKGFVSADHSKPKWFTRKAANCFTTEYEKIIRVHLLIVMLPMMVTSPYKKKQSEINTR